MTARADVLGRIRSALSNTTLSHGVPSSSALSSSAPSSSAPSNSTPSRSPHGDSAQGDSIEADQDAMAYRRRGDVAGAALLDLLEGRLTDYRALVRRATPATLGAEVSAALGRRGARSAVVPPGLHVPLPDFADVTVDHGLTAAELDGFDAVITRAAVAIAETGTIVLDGAPDQGRRAISLVPDYHLCIVAADQVVHLVPEAIERLADRVSQPLTWISGPSATSDIELERVEGVHGPRTLEVILVTP
jgi:L-lactate dehydrogenase complex protein LldG